MHGSEGSLNGEFEGKVLTVVGFAMVPESIPKFIGGMTAGIYIYEERTRVAVARTDGRVRSVL